MPACPPGPAVPVISAGDPRPIGIFDSGVGRALETDPLDFATPSLAPLVLLAARLRDIDVEQLTGGPGT